MSVQAHAWAKTVKTGSPTLKAVLVAVADYADAGGRAWPSQERLAEDTEFSLRAVRNAIAGLEALGVLRREVRFRADGTRRTDVLVLSLSGDINRHEVPHDADQPAPRSKQPAPHTDQPARGAGFTTFEPPLNHQKNHSDASASGRTGEPAEPFSPKDLLWRDGVLTLRGLGLTDPTARRLIGKLMRDTGGDAGRIHWAIDEARAAETGDPIPYVTRLLNDTPTAVPPGRTRPAARQPSHQNPTGQAARLATLHFQEVEERRHAPQPEPARPFLVIDGDLSDDEFDDGRGGDGPGGDAARGSEADRRAVDALQRTFTSRADEARAASRLRNRRTL